jgi:hypothetical protein
MQVGQKIILLLILFVSRFPLSASLIEDFFYQSGKNDPQVLLKDDFESGILEGWGNTSDWENSDENPIRGIYSLKHSNGGGTSYIYHPLEITDLNSDTIVWRLILKNGNWDPSSSNKFWYYLTADGTDLSSGRNGYAVGVNYTGTDDLLKLWRVQNGNVSSTVITSSLDWDPNTLAAIEITRMPGGDWEMKINTEGNYENLNSEGTGSDNTYITSNACGLVFIYTTTRTGLIWMDDAYIGPPIADTIPPVITRAEVSSRTSIIIEFSENVDPSTALDVSNYTVNGSVLVESIEFINDSKDKIILHFENPFQENVSFVLMVSGIKDLEGNLMLPSEFILEYESLQVYALKIIGDRRLKVTFSREISPASAEIIENYTLQPGGVHPLTANLNPNLINEVFLDFAEAFENKQSYQLRVENIRDLLNDQMEPIEMEFVFYIPIPYDIVISEIMARPSPSNGLPGFEFIELLNRSNYTIDLTGWYFIVGSSIRTIPEIFLYPGEYLILCSVNHASLFEEYGKVIGIISFPAIPDAGQTITLLNNADQVISSVSYTDKWYGSSFKASGGWSLEQIDPDNPCAGQMNWTASMDPSGGTPGRNNSIQFSNPDLDAPMIHRAVIISSNTLRVFFSETYYYPTVFNSNYFSVDNLIGSPVQIIAHPPQFRYLDLFFSEPFLSGISYILTVEREITDCAGNLLGTRNQAKFAISAQPDYFDLVVNEILFNPLEGGVDFVEVYNRSNKVIDLKDVLIASRNPSTGELHSINQASSEGFLMFPGDYAVITTSADLVLRDYYAPNKYGFSEISQIPSFNNDKGNVVLLNPGFSILDEFSYNETMHYPLLTKVKGVSLERVNFDQETIDPKNWHSASQTVGFATPAYKNSQYSPGIAIHGGEILIDPVLFSPDNDGVDDLVHIHYEFVKPGFVANITIFDNKGRVIKKLVRNQMLGTNGFFSWDGTNDARQMSPIGLYLIYVDLFHSDGTLKQIKKTCVLAGKLY